MKSRIKGITRQQCDSDNQANCSRCAAFDGIIGISIGNKESHGRIMSMEVAMLIFQRKRSSAKCCKMVKVIEHVERR